MPIKHTFTNPLSDDPSFLGTKPSDWNADHDLSTFVAADITGFNEAAQDAVGTILTDTSTINLTYNDAGDTISADIVDGSVTYAKMQDISAASRLLGRGDSGSGSPQEITLGANLSITGTTLNASAAASAGSAGAVQISDGSGGFDGFDTLSFSDSTRTITIGAADGVSGNSYINSANGNSGNENGVSFGINAGAGFAGANGSGGSVDVFGGNASGVADGGNVNFFGGDAPGTGFGGSIGFEGGSSDTGDAGNVSFFGGLTNGSGGGGRITLGGGYSDSGTGGGVTIYGGLVDTGTPGDVTIKGGYGYSAASTGNVIIGTFDATGTNEDAGDIQLQLGNGIGTGRNGNLIVQNIPTTDPNITDSLWVNNGVVARTGNYTLNWPDPAITNSPFMPSPGLLWHKFKITPGTGTTPVADGGPATFSTTISHPNPSGTTFQTRNQRFISTTTAASSQSGGCFGPRIPYLVSSTSGVGGLRFEALITQTTNVTGHQAFFGICESNATLGGDASALLNMVGIGYDAADANSGNWYLMNNDGSGTATRTDLGSSFARNTTDVLRLIIWWSPGSIDPNYYVENMATPATSYGTISSNRPASGTFLTWKAQIRTGATTTASVTGVYSITIDSPIN